MTRDEAKRILEYGKRNGCHYKRGYCCYQNDNVSKFDMVEIGSNSGVYGWNWTLYFNPKNLTYYLSCYRNAPTISEY